MTLFDFYNRYINLNLNDYSNLRVDLEINKLILIVTLGIVVSSIVVNYNRYLIATLAKKLVRHKACDEKNAKTLAELGLLGVRGLPRLFENNGRVRRLVAIVKDEEGTIGETAAKTGKKANEKNGYRSERFYISNEEECAKLASAPAPTLISTLLFVALVIALGICLTFLMPEILTAINNFLAF